MQIFLRRQTIGVEGFVDAVELLGGRVPEMIVHVDNEVGRVGSIMGSTNDSSMREWDGLGSAGDKRAPEGHASRGPLPTE
jgi:hypothetical protein